MITSLESASPDEPRFPLRLSFVAGALVCSEVEPPSYGQHSNCLIDGRPSPFDSAGLEELSEPRGNESTDPVRIRDVLGGLALFADLAMPDLDWPDMTDAAIAAPATGSASTYEVLDTINDVLAQAEDAWTLQPGVAHMTPSAAPATENWRL